jgi:ABC-type uncharacterized transport system permease subunit
VAACLGACSSVASDGLDTQAMQLIIAIIALFCMVLPVGAKGLARRRGRAFGLSAHPAWVPLGMTLLTVSLTVKGFSDGAWPMATVQGGLQTLALCVAAGWLFLRRRDRMEAAGVILLALVGMLIAVSLLDPPGPVSPAAESPFFLMHLGLIFVGLGAFALSFSLSALFLVQRGRLKSKKLSGIQDLPSLDTLDRLNLRTQGSGFVALSVGIAMGFFLAMELDSSRGLSGLTFWGTVSVWGWYAIGLQSRLTGGWRGKTAAVFGVVGFGAVALILSLATLWMGGWHGV